jgi:hypothetical protein
MTRMHDGTPPARQSDIRPQGAGGADAAAAGRPPQPSGSGEPAVRHVLVSYDEFKSRQQLRRRVMAAFEKLQRERTPDA